MKAEEIERLRVTVAYRAKASAEERAERQAQRLIAIGSRALMKEAHPKLASSKKTVAMIF